MREVLVVELRLSLTVVDRFADYNHCCECEIVVVYDLCQVFQHAAIDLLVGPRQMVAGSHGRVLRVLRQQLLLHVINNGGREEDAHRRLAAGQQVQLLFLGHRCASLATGQDNGLRLFRDGEL